MESQLLHVQPSSPDDTSGKAVEDGPGVWAPAAHMGNPFIQNDVTVRENVDFKEIHRDGMSKGWLTG